VAQDYTLGKWIRERFKSQTKFGAKTGAHPTLISRWMGGGGISEEYQTAIRKLGYTGPWPAEEAQDTAAGGPAPYVSREEYGELVGRLKRLEEEMRALYPLAKLVQDLGERVRKLEGGPDTSA
jgi:hypothetical protein